MSISQEAIALIGKPEDEQLEYKAVLPPSRTLAQLIAAFANTNGGFIILGIAESQSGYFVNGLSEDFRANTITHKAIDLLTPKPKVDYEYATHENKSIYIIKVEQSGSPVSIENKVYIREHAHIALKDAPVLKVGGYTKANAFLSQLEQSKSNSTGARINFIEHYQSIINIINDLALLLYPDSPSIRTNNPEGKILIRVLFASCADNFETYLSDLLYEIYLANPASLKSDQLVTIKEVLECMDIQEFIVYWSKKKLSKLQKGSVKGFIDDNEQIKSLESINKHQQSDIEKILQIRHLYAHRNGIIDEKFLKFYPNQFSLNEEHRLTIEEMIDKLMYLFETVDRVDKAAINKHRLSTLN